MLSDKTWAVYHYNNGTEIDSYVLHFLQELSKETDYLCLVSQTYLSENSQSAIHELVDRVVIVNSDFDAIRSYKAGIDSIGDWSQAEQVILCSSSLFGPVHPFAELLHRLKADAGIDFWGLDYSFDSLETATNLAFISDFLLFNKTAIRNQTFQNFWKAYTENQSKDTFPGNIGGLKSSAIIDSTYLRQYSKTPLLDYPKELIAGEQRCPFFHKETILRPYDNLLDVSLGKSAHELMKYLEVSKYDINHVYDFLIKNQHQADFFKSLHLNYVLPDNLSVSTKKAANNKRILLVMHLYYEDMIDTVFKYALNMPEKSDLIITTPKPEIKAAVELRYPSFQSGTIDVRLIPNRGRDVSSIVLAVKDCVNDYDLVCFVHDKKSTHADSGEIGENWFYLMFENLLGSKQLVQNIIELFHKQERLGILSPPIPVFSGLLMVQGFEWGNNFDSSRTLLDALGIDLPLEAEKGPIAPYGTCFWFRPKAFEDIYKADLSYDDFPQEPNDIDGTILHAFERTYSLAAQNAGYYPAFVMNTDFARLEETNLKAIVRKYNSTCMKHGVRGNPNSIVDTLNAKLTRLEFLEQEVQKLELDNQRIMLQNQELSEELSRTMTTLSWKITKPLRAARGLMR